MGENILTSADAWRVYRVQYAQEPPHFEDRWREAVKHPGSGPNLWTDAYLTAFAKAGDYTIVTFDRGFLSHRGVDVRLLTPAV